MCQIPAAPADAETRAVSEANVFGLLALVRGELSRWRELSPSTSL